MHREKANAILDGILARYKESDEEIYSRGWHEGYDQCYQDWNDDPIANPANLKENEECLQCPQRFPMLTTWMTKLLRRT